MRNAIRLALLIAFALCVLPLAASTDPSTDPTPVESSQEAPEEAPDELSTEELESVLFTPEPVPMNCGTLPLASCTCACDLQAQECRQECGDEDPSCTFGCIQAGKACLDCCYVPELC